MAGDRLPRQPNRSEGVAAAEWPMACDGWRGAGEVMMGGVVLSWKALAGGVSRKPRYRHYLT